MALRTILGSAEQKGKPVFLHFESPSRDQLKQGSMNLDLNKIMQNMGGESFHYDTFKVAYETDPRVKNMIKNFSEEGIELKTSQDVDGPESTSSDDEVEKMAKRATDVGATL